MKLSRFDSVTRAEAGVELVLVDPVTHKKTDASITLFGADSATYKNKQKEVQERNRLAGRSLTNEDTEDNSFEILAACTKGWKGFENEDGTEYLCTFENARKLYKAYPEIYAQAGSFAMSRSNFFGSASGN